MDTARSAEHDVWFVSQDSDFGNGDFHPQLRQEAQDIVGINADRLKLLHGGVDQLLGELAEPAETPEDLKAMLQSPVGAYAANIALSGAEIFFELLPHGSAARIGWASSGIVLGDLDVRRSKAYIVDDRLWASAHLNCRADKIYQMAWAAGQTGVELSPQPVKTSFVFEATMLLEVDNSAIRSADVVALGPVFGKQSGGVADVEPIVTRHPGGIVVSGFVAAGNVPDWVTSGDEAD